MGGIGIGELAVISVVCLLVLTPLLFFPLLLVALRTPCEKCNARVPRGAGVCPKCGARRAS